MPRKAKFRLIAVQSWRAEKTREEASSAGESDRMDRTAQRCGGRTTKYTKFTKALPIG